MDTYVQLQIKSLNHHACLKAHFLVHFTLKSVYKIVQKSIDEVSINILPFTYNSEFKFRPNLLPKCLRALVEI